MKTIIAAIAAVVLQGCGAFPTARGFEQAMSFHMGRSIASIVGDLGPPASEYTLPDGSKVLTYTRSRNMQVGGATQYTPVTSNTTGTLTNGGQMASYRATTTTYQATQTPVTNIALSCTVNFTFDPQGTARSWRSFGNHCVERER